MKNSYNTIEDLLEDESFKRWVRFRENNDYWEQWTLESAGRAKLVEEARVWVLAMKFSEKSMSESVLNEELAKTLEKIRSKKTIQVSKKWLHRAWFKAAAAVFLFGTIFLGYHHIQNLLEQVGNHLVEQNSDGLIEQINNSDKPQLITLADASSVLLQPKSKLSYPKKFSHIDRKVYLSGDAFFEISHDPEKPFYVYSNEVVTQVYGTSFRVKARIEQSNVEVSVRTGIVKVSSVHAIENDVKEDLTLLPNQAARFFKKKLEFEKIEDITLDKSILEAKSSIEHLSFDFKDIPVQQIFKTIEQAYDVEVNFSPELLRSCYLTTSLSDVPLPEKLKIICESIGGNSRFEMNGDQINIISEGCN